MAGRIAGPIFVRERFHPLFFGQNYPNSTILAQAVAERIGAAERAQADSLTRKQRAQIARSVWRDAGAVRPEAVRTAFLRTAGATGLPVTCPKSWRHTFATLLQEANVDPMIRQLVLGHAPNPERSLLGMTAVYTHTSLAQLHSEVIRALRLRPASLQIALARNH